MWWLILLIVFVFIYLFNDSHIAGTWTSKKAGWNFFAITKKFSRYNIGETPVEVIGNKIIVEDSEGIIEKNKIVWADDVWYKVEAPPPVILDKWRYFWASNVEVDKIYAVAIDCGKLIVADSDGNKKSAVIRDNHLYVDERPGGELINGRIRWSSAEYWYAVGLYSNVNVRFFGNWNASGSSIRIAPGIGNTVHLYGAERENAKCFDNTIYRDTMGKLVGKKIIWRNDTVWKRIK